MAPGKKPTKLLNRRATAANKDTTYRNAVESSLLRLPAEIGNRIYGHVLGGYTVHMIVEIKRTAERHKVSHSTCQLREDDTGTYPRCRTWDSSHIHYYGRHRLTGCSMHEPSFNHNVLPLALLRACRQLHGETALLPYAMNTFAFVGGFEFRAFTDGLLAAQRRALRSIVISSVWRQDLAPLGRLTKLVSLTNLTIHAVIGLDWGDGDDLESAGGWFCDEVLERLGDLSLEKATLHLVLSYPVKDAQFIKLDARAKEVEKKLLRSTANEAQEKALVETSV